MDLGSLTESVSIYSACILISLCDAGLHELMVGFKAVVMVVESRDRLGRLRR